jgi:hypothetical protein
MKKCVILKNSLVFNFVKAIFYQNDVLFDYTILSKCQDLCFLGVMCKCIPSLGSEK